MVHTVACSQSMVHTVDGTTVDGTQSMGPQSMVHTVDFFILNIHLLIFWQIVIHKQLPYMIKLTWKQNSHCYC